MALSVLIIDNEDSFTYNLVQVLGRQECTIQVYTHNRIDAADAEAYDRIIFSPGPGLPDEYPIMKEILRRYERTKRILGVCLGHQAIGEYYGGRLINLENVYHGQRKAASVLSPADRLFANIPSTLPVGLYHSWAIDSDSFPDSLRITSLSEDGVIMSLAHRTYDIRGVQFHPESIMTDDGERLLANWLYETPAPMEG